MARTRGVRGWKFFIIPKPKRNYSEPDLLKDEIRVTWDCIFDCLVSIMSLLVCRANVGHDFPIISGTFLCSEASGYFGLDLYHPKITFCLVVIKRDIEVMDKKADWDLVIRKAFYKGKDFFFFFRRGVFSVVSVSGFSFRACSISSSYFLAKLW